MLYLDGDTFDLYEVSYWYKKQNQNYSALEGQTKMETYYRDLFNIT